MNSDTLLLTAVIFFLSYFYLKQGIDYVYVMVDFIFMVLPLRWSLYIPRVVSSSQAVGKKKIHFDILASAPCSSWKHMQMKKKIGDNYVNLRA